MTQHPSRLAAAACTALLAACGDQAPPSADLFPLDPGQRWTYRQVAEWEDDTRDVSELVLRSLPVEDYEDQPAFRRRSDDGVNYWLRRDATGIRRVAMGHELAGEPARDPPGRYVLKEPLAVGTEWQAPTIPYLLRRRQGFPQELRHEGKPVAMSYQIVALQQSVSVPAGRYKGCLQVRGSGAIKLYADAVVGWKDLPITTNEWYCPGPGLVKLERLEPAKSPYLTGGRWTLELEAWSKKG